MYICVSALVYGFNAKASGLDMPPLDNSHTQFSLVPESVFDNSSSFQMARTYFMPDYQRNLVGKQFGGRVNDGGSMGNELNCQKYGYASECLSKKGTQIQVISGLKCWKDCQPLSCADAGYVNSCPSLLTGTSVSLADGTICYTGCRCPSEYKYFKDIANSFKCSLKGTACQEAKDYRGSCPGCPKYKECTCSADYKYVKPETANLNINNIVRTRCYPPKSVGGATCQTYISVTSGGSTHTEAITMYKECNCPEGQEYKNGQCVKIENCDAYPLTGTCPAGCNCTPCPDNGNKYKIDSAKTSEGWSWTSGQTTCPATPCPAGFEAGVEKCSDTQKYTYSSSPKDKSGGKVCGKCTAKNDDCPTNYWNSCAPQHIETGVPQYTEAGTRCTQCRTRKCEEYAPTGTYKTSQPTDYKCTKVNPLGTGASYSVTCYKDCKSDICTSGYSKTACTSSQKQVGTTTTAAGSTCYKCEDIVQEEKCIPSSGYKLITSASDLPAQASDGYIELSGEYAINGFIEPIGSAKKIRLKKAVIEDAGCDNGAIFEGWEEIKIVGTNSDKDIDGSHLKYIYLDAQLLVLDQGAYVRFQDGTFMFERMSVPAVSSGNFSAGKKPYMYVEASTFEVGKPVICDLDIEKNMCINNPGYTFLFSNSTVTLVPPYGNKISEPPVITLIENTTLNVNTGWEYNGIATGTKITMNGNSTINVTMPLNKITYTGNNNAYCVSQYRGSADKWPTTISNQNADMLCSGTIAITNQ